jgi:hypothetical protein
LIKDFASFDSFEEKEYYLSLALSHHFAPTHPVSISGNRTSWGESHGKCIEGTAMKTLLFVSVALLCASQSIAADIEVEISGGGVEMKCTDGNGGERSYSLKDTRVRMVSRNDPEMSLPVVAQEANNSWKTVNANRDDEVKKAREEVFKPPVIKVQSTYTYYRAPWYCNPYSYTPARIGDCGCYRPGYADCGRGYAPYRSYCGHGGYRPACPVSSIYCGYGSYRAPYTYYPRWGCEDYSDDCHRWTYDRCLGCWTD